MVWSIYGDSWGFFVFWKLVGYDFVVGGIGRGFKDFNSCLVFNKGSERINKILY